MTTLSRETSVIHSPRWRTTNYSSPLSARTKRVDRYYTDYTAAAAVTHTNIHTHTHTYISRPLDKAEKLFVRKLISSLSPEYIYIYIVQGGRGDDPARPAVVIPPHFPPPRVCACVLRARPRMDFRCVVCCWLARHSLLLANVRCSFLELRRAALP